MKSFITFEAAFPDDSEFDRGGDIKRPGGQNVAACLAKALASILSEVSHPAQYSSYGWEITGSDGSRKYWFLLQRSDAWLLIAEDRTGLLRRFRSPPSNLESVLGKLVGNLSQDRLFDNIRRFTEDEFEAAG